MKYSLLVEYNGTGTEGQSKFLGAKAKRSKPLALRATALDTKSALAAFNWS